MAKQASRQPSQRGLGQLELWAVLFIMLSLLGVAGAISYSLLQQVTQPPSVTDIAERVCTAYTTQNYQLLISQIDPSPITGITPAASSVSPSGTFDASLKNSLVSQLKTLDVNFGPVTSCQQHQLVFKGTVTPAPKVEFVFDMHRSGTPNVTYSCVMSFVQHSGSWMITRDSNFIGNPG